ncbi:glycosyl transferase family 2 [bacterium]|nr:glycosyl transferase family 2 [bacterium]
MRYSVVVPAHNESDSIGPLYDAISPVMNGLSDGDSWELIIVDDGSSDDTLKRLQELRQRDDHVKVISFRRNFGQTAAWSAGFDHATGDLVIVLDADLQNDPQDIPAMLENMRAEDLDVISGWRKDRKDKGGMVILSKFGNYVHRWVTGEKIHDHGCSLKIYKKEALADLELYGEMHRYITALLSWKGFKIGEMVVRHHPRQYGDSGYTLRKKLKGFLDLIVVKFWIQYSTRPMHFFGSIGIVFIVAGIILGGVLGGLWLFRVIGLDGRSTPLLAVLLVLLGFQFLLTGVLADVVAKTYYMQKKAYSIKEADGF